MRAHRSVAAAFVLVMTVTGCTLGDGEGARYTARVVSVTGRRLCVGPSESSDQVECGQIPREIRTAPRVGQCVSLFSKERDKDGRIVSWTASSLRLKVSDGRCLPLPSPSQ
jgi:hypothetical protein